MAEQDFDIKIRTTADTAGVQQTAAALEELKQKAGPAGQPVIDTRGAQEMGTLIGQLVGRLAGVGLIYQGINNIREVAEQTNKISEELDKQGEQLVKHAQHYAEEVRSVQSEADILKIAHSALNDIDAVQSKIQSTMQQEVGITGKWVDSFGHLIQQVRSYGMASEQSGRINQQAIDAQIKGLQDLRETADQTARGVISSGYAFKEAFDRRMAMDYEEAVAEIGAEIDDLTEKQKNLDEAAPDYVKKWSQAQQHIEEANKTLDAVVKKQEQLKKESQETADEHEKDVDFWQKQVQRAPPQVQRILMNEAAARQAAAEGREKDAAMLEKSAEAFKRGATPQQLEQVKTLEGAKDIVEAVNRLADLWK